MSAGVRQALARRLLLAALVPAPLCAAPLEVQLTDPAGRPVAGAVVFLESPAAARAVRPMEAAEIAQEGKQFAPLVSVVTRGTAVQFPNRDTVRHHVYSLSPAKRFELKLYIGKPESPVVFDQAGVAVLGCNIHDRMVGWVLVLDTPYHARTDAAGRATLDAPAGAYQLRAWHEALPPGPPAPSQPLALAAAGATARLQVPAR